MQTFTGLEYLKIDIASNFGLDKKTWGERLAWFEENKDNLLAFHNQAKDPALYFAGVQAYAATLRGEPSGYPISLDATASGIQLLSVMTGDRKAATLCNVVNTGDRENAYEAIFDIMTHRAGPALAGQIDPDQLKRAVMTSCYGSEEEPKKAFGTGELYEIFIEVMEDYAPGVWRLNKAFLKEWDPTRLVYEWTMPDNFHVKIKVMETIPMDVEFLGEGYTAFRSVNQPKERGRSLGANVTHALDGMLVREMVRRCSYDPAWIQLLRDMLAGENEFRMQCKAKKEAETLVPILWANFKRTGYLSARILTYLDSDTIQLVDETEILQLLGQLPAKPFNLLTTHDCFRCLPNYGNDLRRQYNRLLYDVAKSSILTDLLNQITGDKWEDDKLDPTLADDILETEYALS